MDVTIVYSCGTRETAPASTPCRRQWLIDVECTELGRYETASDGNGDDVTLGELVADLPVQRARQREWVLIRNESDGGWSVVDHVATRQANL